MTPCHFQLFPKIENINMDDIKRAWPGHWRAFWETVPEMCRIVSLQWVATQYFQDIYLDTIWYDFNTYVKEKVLHKIHMPKPSNIYGTFVGVMPFHFGVARVERTLHLCYKFIPFYGAVPSIPGSMAIYFLMESF